MEENVIKGYLAIKGEQGLSAYEVAVANGFEGSEQDWLATLGTSSFFSQFSESYTTTESTTDFVLPEEYIDGCFVDVYVDGLHIPSSGYTITEEDNDYIVRFDTPVESGKTVELVVTQITTNNLPISDTLDDNSTNETASGSKVVYDTITGLQATIPNMSSIVDLIYPVGSIYMSVNTTNPSTIFQGTTWEAVGQGRTLVGAGTGVDSANVSKTFESGANGGWYNAVVVSHNHSASTGSAGKHAHNIRDNFTYRESFYKGDGSTNAWYKGSRYVYTNETGAHTHGVTVNSNGVSGVNRNIQPYLVVNMWKRTA